jgi:uncharacterized protein YcnI
MRRRAWITITFAAAVVVALLDVAAASAHAIVRPSASRPAELQLYTLTVPTEREVPTVGVDLKVPEGIDFFLVEKKSPWQAKLVMTNGRVSEVRWSGDSVPPDFFVQFKFIARNPILAGTISWRIVQRYADGKDVFWIGSPTADNPAATTDIAESAVPVDVLAGLNGGSTSSATSSSSSSSSSSSAAPESSESSDGGGRDSLTLVLAIAGLVAGGVALVLVLVRRRGGST